jgi:hypothetical protein
MHLGSFRLKFGTKIGLKSIKSRGFIKISVLSILFGKNALYLEAKIEKMHRF